MRYSNIIKNDIVNGENICVSFWTQGCPTHCPGCQNEPIWDFNGGKEFTPATISEIIQAISANGIQRNFSILGGEPLCDENLFLTTLVIQEVRKVYPNIKIFLWTGYYYENLLKKENPHLKYIFDNINYLIDGPFIQAERDITLKLRGSHNQHIISMPEGKVEE